MGDLSAGDHWEISGVKAQAMELAVARGNKRGSMQS
jgi:hypothetical protein